MIEARQNPDWYRVKYNLAALHANWSASLNGDNEAGRTEALGYRETAHAHARELAEAALEQLVERSSEANPALLRLLEKAILPAALILYGGTGPRLRQGRAKPGRPHRFFLHDSPRSQRELLDQLRSGLNDSEALQYAASIQRPTPRTLYNLACAHAQDGELKEAKACLQRALRSSTEAEGKQLAQRAAADPSLRPLKQAGGLGTAEAESAEETKTENGPELA